MTKIKTITTYTVLIIVSLMMMFGISRIENSLDKDVKEYHLRFTGDIKNSPAFITFTTVALGSFRGGSPNCSRKSPVPPFTSAGKWHTTYP